MAAGNEIRYEQLSVCKYSAGKLILCKHPLTHMEKGMSIAGVYPGFLKGKGGWKWWTVLEASKVNHKSFIPWNLSFHSLYWSIHTKDESKSWTMFAFIFGLNGLWCCGVTASFGKRDGMTSVMEFMKFTVFLWGKGVLISNFNPHDSPITTKHPNLFTLNYHKIPIARLMKQNWHIAVQ